MFVLVAILPVSADSVNQYYLVAPNINQGATIFIGEQGLNITPALDQVNAAGVPSNYTTIGWWASAADIHNTAPSVSIDTTGRAGTFYVDQTDFDGYEGQWYLVASDQNQRAKPGVGAVFNVKAPKHRSSPSVLKQTPMDLALVTPRLITRTANLRETKSM